MAARRLWDRPTDLGARYLTVSDPEFRRLVDEWSARGLAAPWTDTFTVLGDSAPTDKDGPVRWGAPHGLRSLVEDLARDLDVERVDVSSVDEVSDGAQVVVLAMPDPQALRLVGGHPVADVLDRAWEPVLALAARWPSRTWDDVSPSGRFEGAFVNDDPVIGWIADDGRRRGDDAPVLVAHSTPELAARHLTEPSAAATRDGRRAAPPAATSTSRRTSTSTGGRTPARSAGARRRTPSSTVRVVRSRCAVTAGARRPRSRRRGSPAPASGASWVSGCAGGTRSRARAGSRSTRRRGSRPAARPRSHRRR